MLKISGNPSSLSGGQILIFQTYHQGILNLNLHLM